MTVKMDIDAGTSMRQLFTVNELARELAVTPRAIRFYEAKGLLAPRRAGTTRVFDRRDRARLLIVLRGNRLGFSLQEIRDYLDLYDADRSQRVQVHLLLERARARIGELELRRRDIDQVLDELRDIEQQAISALASRETAKHPQQQTEHGEQPRQNRQGRGT